MHLSVCVAVIQHTAGSNLLTQGAIKKREGWKKGWGAGVDCRRVSFTTVTFK